jgi:hypothetical protein
MLLLRECFGLAECHHCQLLLLLLLHLLSLLPLSVKEELWYLPALRGCVAAGAAAAAALAAALATAAAEDCPCVANPPQCPY